MSTATQSTVASSQTNETNYSKINRYTEYFEYGVQQFFCWNVVIPFPFPSTKGLCWKPMEIPVLQYAICIIQTVISFYPDTIWGPNNVFIFNTFVLGFLTLYLALRFAWVTEKHSKITECDKFVVQTLVYVITVSYVYNQFVIAYSDIGG
jgi:hypothetical protein